MRPTMILAAALTLAMVPVGLSAKPGNGNGNGHANQNGNGHGNQHTAAQHDDDHGQNDVDGGNHGCPPGLAGRDPACVPPGLARQGVTTDDWIGPITTEYVVGDVIYVDEFRTVTDLRKNGLTSLPEGQEYAVVDDTLVILDSETYEILELIRVAASMFD